MKKIFGLLVVALTAFLLVGCSQASLDGTYYAVDDTTNDVADIYSGIEMIIEGDTAILEGTHEAIIDTKEKTITVVETNRTTRYEVESDGDIIVIKGYDKFVKVDSKTYKKYLEDGGKLID